MPKGKTTLSALFFLILLSLNVIYFFIYFSLLDLPFSGWHFFFLLGIVASFFLLTNFLKFKFWQAICCFLFGGLYVASLVNFGYFRVYNAFISFSLKEAASLDASLLKHLKDFVYLIPGELYVAAGVIFVGVVVNTFTYYYLSTRDASEIVFNSSLYKMIAARGARSARQVALVIVLFCAVNLAAFGAAAYFYNNPKETWWNITNQIADIGFTGHFYSQIYAQANKKEAVGSNVGAMTEAQDVYRELARLSGYEKTTVPLPAFEKRPNILLVQLESVGSWAIENEPSPMPFLRSLIKENISVPNFYPNSCETINAEFSALCSFLPNSKEPINYSHKENNYRCLPLILKEKYGYSSALFHANVPEFWDRNVLAPKWGFEKTYFTPFFRQKQDDASSALKMVDELVQLPKPFFAQFVTFTTHTPHNDEMIQYHQEKNNLTIAPFTQKIDEWLIQNSEITEKGMRDYFGFLQAEDEALKVLFAELADKKLIENTIIFIYNDHRFYRFTGQDEAVKKFAMYNRNPFLIVFPDKRSGQIQNIASHVDVAPTILNLIEGDEYAPEKIFFGTSLFADNFAGMSLNKCLGNIFFVNKDVIVEGGAKSGVYRVMHSTAKLAPVQEENWLGLVKRLVEKSDEAIYNNELVEKGQGARFDSEARRAKVNGQK